MYVVENNLKDGIFLIRKHGRQKKVARHFSRAKGKKNLSTQNFYIQ